MAKRICQMCNGAKNIVVVINGKKQVVICTKCGGTGEEEIS